MAASVRNLAESESGQERKRSRVGDALRLCSRLMTRWMRIATVSLAAAACLQAVVQLAGFGCAASTDVHLSTKQCAAWQHSLRVLTVFRCYLWVEPRFTNGATK